MNIRKSDILDCISAVSRQKGLHILGKENKVLFLLRYLPFLSLRSRNNCVFSKIKVELLFLSNTCYFVRSGFIHYGGRTYDSGLNGYAWSVRAYTNAYFQHSFNLYFNATGVSPSFANYYYWGYPLRCLVR